MRLTVFAVMLAFAIMTVFVSAAQTSSADETGLEGVITVSPVTAGPVRADSPSSRPLANTAFVVHNQSSQVASFTTDEQGRFRTILPLGHYKVSRKGRNGGIGKFGPFEVDVVPGKMTNVHWECDTGIR